MNNNNEISSAILNNGFFYKKKWLDEKTVEKLKTLLIKNNAIEKANNNGIFSMTTKQLIRDILYFKFNRFLSSIYLIKLSKKLELEKIADKIFGEKSNLKVIDGYISKISDKKILQWHQDQAFSGKENVRYDELRDPENSFIKFFFFLTPVKMNNGSLAYIPESNKIAIAFKKALKDKEISYSPFWKLSDFRKLVKKEENKKILLKYISEETFGNFEKNTKFIDIQDDTDKFDQKLQPGDAIIFDEHGFHRGSVPKYNDRFIIRFCFSRARFE